MKKVKLQVQLTVDGFNSDPAGNTNWRFATTRSNDLTEYLINLVDSCDLMLLGRKMADPFIKNWTAVVNNPKNPDYSFTKKLLDMHKVVFSKTITEPQWENTVIANGDLKKEVEKLKTGTRKDIFAFGETSLATSLLKEGLVDELYLIINPVVLGKGGSIFKEIPETRHLTLMEAISFDCGIVSLAYKPKILKSE